MSLLPVILVAAAATLWAAPTARVRLLRLSAVGRIPAAPSLRHRVASRRLRPEQSDCGVELLAALAAELGAGLPPAAALKRALADNGEPGGPAGRRLARTNAALELGGDVPAGLRGDAADAGRDRQWLVGLAVAWEVSESLGAALAPAVSRLARSERDRAEVRRELRAELAGPRATALLLAALPLAGLGLGSLLGAQPLRWLTGSPIGWLDLALAAVLVVLGLRWVSRIIAGVERLL